MMTRFLSLETFLLVVSCTLPICHAQGKDAPTPLTPDSLAQHLADLYVEQNKDLQDVIFHVTPSGSNVNMAIASHSISERGKPSGNDDLDVMRTGKPLVEIQKDGARIGVLLPLDDASKHRIGALGLMFAYRAGQDPKAFLVRAREIRNLITSQIPSRQALEGKAQ